MSERRSGHSQRQGPGGRPTRRVQVDPARLAAYDVLRTVRLDAAYTNLVLPGLLAQRRVTGRDAAFATELVSGTIRRQASYDAIIDACLTKPKLEAKVRDVLRLGAHQLLNMRVGSHAAVSTSVDLVRDRIGQGPVGLANAVLRKISEHSFDSWMRRLAPPDELGFAALVHSHPRWIVGGLRDALSDRAEELDALLAANNAAPRVTLVARPGLTEELRPTGTLSPYAVQITGDPGEVPAVAEGRAGVQDEGSQVVAVQLANAALDGPDRLWLDACAGPGGKAALLGALAAQRGVCLIAAERQRHRAVLVQRGMRALPQARVVVADATRPAWANDTFDRVLLDVPCSGVGALRRRPESRWRRTPGDVRELVALQHAILDQAFSIIRPGGLIGYATCSPLLPETAEIVQPVLDAGRAEIVPIDLPDAAGPIAGTMQLWPHRHGTDAMFLAVLRVC